MFNIIVIVAVLTSISIIIYWFLIANSEFSILSYSLCLLLTTKSRAICSVYWYYVLAFFINVTDARLIYFNVNLTF